MLSDWLVVGQVVPTNPAHSVRGPKHVVKRGKTPVLTREETRELLDSIDTDTIRGLRDRALIGVLVYSFARIGAALALKVDDYFPEGKRWKLRLHEKGGKEHVVPVHHTAVGARWRVVQCSVVGVSSALITDHRPLTTDALRSRHRPGQPQ